MQRFLRNCTAVLLAVAALLWAGGALYRHTTTYKNLERTEETDKYDAMPDKISFAVFGSSHRRAAFQAAVLPDNGDDMVVSQFFCVSLTPATFAFRDDDGAVVWHNLAFELREVEPHA